MDNIKSESTEKILDAYNFCKSIKGVVKDTGYSWNKVVKTLSSEGIVVSDLHSEILELYKSGYDCAQIAKVLSISERTVQSYIPRMRPVYNENLSDNAKRIVKCRKNKKK